MAVFSHVTVPRAQEGCVLNTDPRYTQSNVLLKDRGTQRRSPTTVFRFDARAQLLSSQTAGLQGFMFSGLRLPAKRIRSLLLESIESKDFTLLHQRGLCFVEPNHQLRG